MEQYDLTKIVKTNDRTHSRFATTRIRFKSKKMNKMKKTTKSNWGGKRPNSGRKISTTVRYVGLLSCWFNADGSIGERPDDDQSVFAEWTAQGYKTEVGHDELTDEWLKHFDTEFGIIVRQQSRGKMER